MAMQTRLTRLARLEAAGVAEQFPTVLEFHRCTPVSSDDPRRGACVIEGNQVTFFSASAAEYESASSSYAAGRNIILISVDARCLNFTPEKRNDPTE